MLRPAAAASRDKPLAPIPSFVGSREPRDARTAGRGAISDKLRKARGLRRRPRPLLEGHPGRGPGGGHREKNPKCRGGRGSGSGRHRRVFARRRLARAFAGRSSRSAGSSRRRARRCRAPTWRGLDRPRRVRTPPSLRPSLFLGFSVRGSADPRAMRRDRRRARRAARRCRPAIPRAIPPATRRFARPAAPTLGPPARGAPRARRRRPAGGPPAERQSRGTRGNSPPSWSRRATVQPRPPRSILAIEGLTPSSRAMRLSLLGPTKLISSQAPARAAMPLSNSPASLPRGALAMAGTGRDH